MLCMISRLRRRLLLQFVILFIAQMNLLLTYIVSFCPFSPLHPFLSIFYIVFLSISMCFPSISIHVYPSIQPFSMIFVSDLAGPTCLGCDKQMRLSGPYPLSQSSFQNSTAGSALFCAICLGVHKNIYQCCLSTLFNRSPALYQCNSCRTMVFKSSGNLMCLNWQSTRCWMHSYSTQHVCSGCGATSHGSSVCTLQQKGQTSHTSSRK